MSKMVLDKIKIQLKDLTGDELDKLAGEIADILEDAVSCETCDARHN